MANSAELKVTIDIPEQETLDLVKALAHELGQAYKVMDRVGAMVGQPPYPRNEELLTKFRAFVDGMKVRD